MIRIALVLAGLGCIPNLTAAQSTGGSNGIAQALREGSFDLALRYRFEIVDQQDLALRANASTLRTRFNFTSADYRGFGLVAEIDDLRGLGADGFNSTRNGKLDRPVVADPSATDVNQLFVRYSSPAGTRYALGRQSFTFTSRRYVGSVNWRQNEQTFDALTIAHDFSEDFELGYAYVTNANRVFGPDAGMPEPDFRGAFQLLDAKYELGEDVAIHGYAYFLNFDSAADLSSSTLGVRVTGSRAITDSLRIGYTAEFAGQRDHARNPTNYDASYLVLEAGLNWANASVLAGVEHLEGGGRPGEVFTTPLAALHQYNGWSDQFLSLPDDGLSDRYLKLARRLGAVQLTIAVHGFEAERGGRDYGREFDVSVSWPFLESYSVLLKAADYRADELGVDVRKLWLMLNASF